MISGNKTFLRRALAVFAVIAAGSTCAAETAGWNIEQLMQSLRQVTASKSRFVERKYLAVLNTPLESSGTLVYTAPGRLEKYTVLPKPETLLLEQDKLTIEYKERNQRRTLALQDYPVVWAFVESIRSTLAGDLNTLSRFYRVALEGSEDKWHLTLRPADPTTQSLVREIHIGGSKNNVRSIEIIEVTGDRSVMTISAEGT
ncbi:MAG: LolA-related protein [Burkholderiales bacterium]